ncbi:MAG TPA: ArsB/NhaD family transporter [Solirubrobacteraceae bacterium]|nr:ArsB/NhaD family transporter [Solirubrobacteraceae bacterium]
MREAAAVSALALTLGLTLRRPLLPTGLRVGPGLAAVVGVAVAIAVGGIHGDDVVEAGETLWRPFLALIGLMVITGAAGRLGLMDRLAALVVPRAGGSPTRLFGLVFVLSAGTAAVLNNDAAILLLTPVVVLLVRGLYPERPGLLVPFAFAVFMAAGVAPFVTSNPMNTVVAGVAEIGFNEYAATMAPVAVAALVVTYVVLRLVFARELRSAPAVTSSVPAARWERPQRQALALVLAVLCAYPVFALAGVEVFVVAAAGAVVALALCARHRAGGPVEVLRTNVAWEILVFLLGMFLLAEALRNAGVVARLTDLYEDGGQGVIGVTSAIGSALLNNHSMALTNLLAVEGLPATTDAHYFAALVGGDLGPRLLPIGSLAGLLWIAVLRGLGVEVTLRRFVTVGVAVTVPSLAVSLGVLALLT